MKSKQARRNYTCHSCKGEITKGQRYYLSFDVKHCQTCEVFWKKTIEEKIKSTE